MTLNKDNSESEKGPGRPVGSTKNGVKSRNKKMQLLRTKTWAWTCSYYLQESEENKPVTTYSLQEKSEIALEGAYPKSIKDKSGNKIIIDDERISADRWGRWRKGERGLPRAGGFRYIKGEDGKKIKKFPRTKLFPEVEDAYNVGPWINVGPFRYYGDGLFIPLWNAITGNIEGLLREWDRIQIPAEPESDEFGNPLGPELYFPKKKFKKLAAEELHEFCHEIFKLHRNGEDLPPLMLLSLAITSARIASMKGGIKYTLLFDPKNRDSILPSIRSKIVKDLAEINITLSEICEACSDYGLLVKDCGSLSYEEYKKAKLEQRIITSKESRGRMPQMLFFFQINPGFISDIENPYFNVENLPYEMPEKEITEKEWRDFFGTTE